MGIEVKIIADSIYYPDPEQKGLRVTTMQLKYHRYIHGEFMTHRVFSRNASSSRAIPIKTFLKQVWNDPAIPLSFGKNQSGMQAKRELTGIKRWVAEKLWRTAAKAACVIAWSMDKVGLHKQTANRILEPFQYIHVIMTSTEWDNFFALRDHPDAQPEIQHLAREMRMAYLLSYPEHLEEGEFHLPYVHPIERLFHTTEDLLKISTARCARVSYLTHDGKEPSVEKDIKLHERLVGSEPLHASPTEHQCVPSGDDKFHKNFRGFIQYRAFVESQIKSQNKLTEFLTSGITHEV